MPACIARSDAKADRSREDLDRGAALTSRLQTLETGMLAQEQNFPGSARVNRELIGKSKAIDGCAT
jgi:hypothetical protein